MKAKTYAELYKGGANHADIMYEFVREMQDIAKVRNVQLDRGVIGILNEQEQKWKAFCRLCPDFLPEGFESIIGLNMPSVYVVWKGKEFDATPVHAQEFTTD